MLSLRDFHDVTMKCVELKTNGLRIMYETACLKVAVEMSIPLHDVITHMSNAISTIANNGDYFRFLAESIVRMLKEDAKLDVKKDYSFYKILEPMMEDYATNKCIKDIDAAVLMSNTCKCVKPSKQIDEWCDEFNYRYFKGYVFTIAGIDYITDEGFQLVKNVVESINKEN